MSSTEHRTQCTHV